MPIIVLLVYIPSIIGILLIGLVTTFRRKSQGIGYFSLMTFSIAIWLSLQLLTQSQIFGLNQLLLVRASSAVSNLFPLFFVLFVFRYIDVKLPKLAIGAIVFFSSVFSLLNFTDLMITQVKVTSIGIAVEEAGTLYFLQILLSFALYLIGLIKLFQKSRKTDPFDRERYNLLIFGVSQALVVNVLGTTVFTASLAVQLAMVASFLIMVAFTAYAIIKHKLFDIKLVVARTLGYVLSIGLLALVYGVLAFSIIDGFIFTDTTSTTVKRTTFTLLAVILATSYQPLKKRFDRWSNKIFYRDAYDSQELLDRLNRVLLATIEIDKLLKNSAEVINQSIKAEFVIFGIKQIKDSPQRIIGTSDRQFTKEDIEQVRKITPGLHQKSIVVDELEEKDIKLRDLLRKNDIAMILRLTDTPNKNQEGLGYIVLGNKKSGSPYTRQDIQVLEIIADELVIAIQNALRFEEIQNFTVTLQEKVDDATKKLRKANNRLIELDQTKDDFISMASHQLRTPLTSIKGYISMIMEGDVGKISKKQTEMLDQAFISSQRMVYLIADLLNVSRLRTGKFVIEPKETNLADVIEGEIAQLKETAKGRDLELVYKKPKAFPALMLDETKIRQVIMNFADNAIYYTPSGGHINVELIDKGEVIELTVTDDGIGVPKAEQHHLFNKFYRAGNAKKARPDGTGLGLFMAKKVVIAQGGSIIFKTQEGKGSTFGFSFTKKPLLPENYKGVI